MTPACIVGGCTRRREIGSVFCGVHISAPAGQRGGWLSAYQRAKKRGNDVTPIDASNIAKRLWVGGKPPLDRDLPDFDVLVLCAEEIQPKQVGFGRQLIRCPLPDAQLTPGEARLAISRARVVAAELAAGKRVLVTCYAGWNRSALVAGLALATITRMTAGEIVVLIRGRRSPSALGNRHFVRLIETYVGLARR